MVFCLKECLMELSDVVFTPLTLKQRFTLFRCLMHLKVREYLTYDSFFFKKLSAILGLAIGLFLWTFGKKLQGFTVFSSIHRANYSEQANSIIASLFKMNTGSRDNKKACISPYTYREYISNLSPDSRTSRFFENPERILGSRLLVLKSPKNNEKGVIVVDYSFALPILAKFFDVCQIAE